MGKSALILACLCFAVLQCLAQDHRWTLSGREGISWTVNDKGLPHKDHIEMSGKFISAVIRYGVNADRSFYISRDIVWPMLRTIPNNTHASLTRSFSLDPVKLLYVNKKPVKQESVGEIMLNGKITVISTLEGDIRLERILFPSVDLPVFCEFYSLKNISNKVLTVEIPNVNILASTDSAAGTEGSYSILTTSGLNNTVILHPGGTANFSLCFLAKKVGQEFKITDVSAELSKRNSFLSALADDLVLETPDSILNRAFAFAKIRAAESIFETKGGPMHGPGGLSYYAAIWANDQAEYINPFFPYLGYDYGIASALNAYRHFARFMNPGYKPIPSSIIAEGADIWNGAGDRGDAAMIAYGAARFSLSQGDPKIAEELWPLIEWCLEYNRRHLNSEGVVNSDSDELEGRFPSGDANLCTSSLYYDALLSAVYLGRSLGITQKQLSAYSKEASALRVNIEKFFGADIMGFHTYRYYKGNDVLRAWICIPLTVNIFERKQGTIEALFSPELWTADGLASQSGDKTFWDRSTLYALRGVFAAGDTKRGLQYLQYYSNRRLLGEHVPYPVEAFPEGNQRHLSAESGLYCRIYTEGLFGIRPTGLRSFTLSPSLPQGWKVMKLGKISGFGSRFDAEVKADGQMLNITVSRQGKTILNKTIKPGGTVEVRMP